MKALITGISGFSGRHLAELLKKEKIKVTGIDLNNDSYYRADLTDKKRVTEIVNKEQPEYIFHLASPVIRSDTLVDDTLVKNLKVDLFGSVNLIQAVAGLKHKPRMLITGTAAEYDVDIKGGRKETDRLKPNTSYGLSKMTQELLSRKLAESYGIDLIYSRSFLLIGPGQKPGFVINDWCCQLAGKSKVLTTGNLKTKRDFTDIRDAVKAYWLLINKGKAGEIYNVCSGKAVELTRVIAELKNLTDHRFKVKELKSKFRSNDPIQLFGNNQKLINLGWRAEKSLKTSLKDILDYWRETDNKA